MTPFEARAASYTGLMPDWSPQSENLRVSLAEAAERSGQPAPVEFIYLRTQTSQRVTQSSIGEVAATTDTAFHELRQAGLIQVLNETSTEVRFYFKEPPKAASELMGRVERVRDILVSRATGGGSYADDSEYRDLRATLRLDPAVGQRMPDWLKQVRNLDEWWGFIKPKFGSYAERRTFLSEEFDPVLTYLEETYPGIVPTPPPRPEQPASRPAPAVEDASAWGNFFETFFKGGVSPQVASSTHSHTTPSSGPSPGALRVFVVHGHDYGPRDSVARLLSRLGFDPVILDEQPNKGRTIIEKFVDYTNVAYAVVVMTPDDMGAQKGGGTAKPRARQNVVLELGFFIGRLGRDHVAAVVVGNVEQPSDVQGVLYIPFDAAGAWRGKLAREMKEAGLPVDFNRLA